MDGRRDPEEAARGGLGRGRRLLLYYVIAGAVLAILRIALIIWGTHNHEMFYRWNLYWVFYPEGFTDFQPTGRLRITALYVAGSYLLATPVLAAGWLLHRPRLGRQVAVSYLTCGAVLAIARIAVFVSVIDLTKAEWSIPWLLYPEALLLVHTRLGVLGRDDYSFVFAVLLAIGSFVMATPVLLERGLWLKHR